LDRGANSNSPDKNGETALSSARWYKHSNVAGLLQDRGAFSGHIAEIFINFN